MVFCWCIYCDDFKLFHRQYCYTPFVNKFTSKDSFIKTNSASLEGKVGKVTIDIDPINSKGQIKVNGETWSAKSIDNTYISKDTEIIIEKIEGVKAIVKPLV